jgi:hypothetical protein
MCDTCGGSDEVKGDFVAYQSVSRSTTQFDGQYKTTTTFTRYLEVTPFSYSVCVECARATLLASLRQFRILNAVLLWSAGVCPLLAGVTYAIYRGGAPPNWAAGVFAASAAIGIFAAAIWFFEIFGEFLEYKELAAGFPSDRVKVSKVILKLFEKRVLAYTQSLKPTKYSLGSAWKGRNFFVVSLEEWTTKIAPKRLA